MIHSTRYSTAHAARTLAALSLLFLGLTACGGGEPTVANPVTVNNISSSAYSGPVPATADIQSFKLNVWDNLSPDNRCGACHGTGNQAPTFVRSDDINLAYAEANGIVDLGTPANSPMVSKVGGGHNCWLGSTPAAWQACADTITAWISDWAGGKSSAGNVITLTAPALVDPGDSKSFPGSSGLFASTVHKVLTDNCANCHTESANSAQSPFFANSDPDLAYEHAKSKIDLDNPANSRFVLRLRYEFHNCWDPNLTGSSDCAASALVMENAITAFASQIQPDAPADELLTSKAMTLLDGIVASGGNRIEDNVIALYQFKEGTGTTAFDTSGVAPAMHLTLSGGVGWVGGWGLDITSGKAQATTASSRKLHDLITATGEYTVEAWVVPANVSQDGPARIISYSAGTTDRNFTLGQTMYSYDFLQRSTSTDANGDPALSTAAADEDLQATLQHVVLTYDPVNGRRIYVNKVFTDDIDPVAGGSLVDWDNSFAFVLGNETSSDRQWQGKLRMVAIHNRALTPEQIEQNYSVGVGEKFFLLFNVDEYSGMTDSYVLFEVSQFDSYSYLFNQPRFINLDPAATPIDIPVAGMRIGINGKEATAGQAYRNIDTVLKSPEYSPGTGQPLSDIGTVIALEKGPGADEFFLTFEVFGNDSNIVLEAAPLAPTEPLPDLPPAADIGVRNYDEINASMSAITGVSRQQVDVKKVFGTIKQQLPTVENIDGFLSAHQMAISQLAIEYCSALVDNKGAIAREDYFPGFFTAGQPPESADSAFDSTPKRALVTGPLVDNVMNTGLTVQPDPAAVSAELDSLIAVLTACATGTTPSCATSTRTEQIVKASCAAVLGSAAMLIQ
jgi:mono/diheme cytochrome c family protein